MMEESDQEIERLLHEGDVPLLWMLLNLLSPGHQKM
jgi:hypothetical protein